VDGKIKCFELNGSEHYLNLICFNVLMNEILNCCHSQTFELCHSFTVSVSCLCVIVLSAF
jgi:hypothetical protein